MRRTTMMLAFLALFIVCASAFRPNINRNLLASVALRCKNSDSPAVTQEQQGQQGQQGPISYDPVADFARADIKIPAKKPPTLGSEVAGAGRDSRGARQQQQQQQQQQQRQPSVEERLRRAYDDSQQRPRENGWKDNPDRGTGYGIPDEDDDEAEMQELMKADIEAGRYVPPPPSADKDDFQRWVRSTYIGSPYDSRKKKQARYVVRNITVISVLIGIIFTAVWYLSPVPFVSRVDDRDFNAVYRERAASGVVPGLQDDSFEGMQGNRIDKAPVQRSDEYF